MSITELEAEALKLPPDDQARLLHRLASALDAFETPELTNEELEKRGLILKNPERQASKLLYCVSAPRQRYGLS